ncbi:hypothetical protein BJ944DRAFT_263676 [Cunninghamella echinulata]|nr:hypothetical protein BJ944DRAFT_263676 [Cunninghamella echinulata]
MITFVYVIINLFLIHPQMLTYHYISLDPQFRFLFQELLIFIYFLIIKYLILLIDSFHLYLKMQ